MRRFFVQRDKSAPPSNVSVLRVGNTLFTGEDDFASAFGDPSSLESDMLLLASAVFAADRAYARGEREGVCRNFELSFPIVNHARLHPLVFLIEKILYRLSNDAWKLEFRQGSGSPEGHFRTPKEKGRTLLFSGGLDSLAAAIEFGKSPGSLQLVSHKTRNRINDASQKALYKILKNKGYKLKHYQCFISSRSGGASDLQHDEENTQRTRSFVFLILGALMARRSGHKEIIYLAENGQMAIHLPLTHGRIGAFSTHTAHPEVLLSMQGFLSQALDMEFRIINPYVHRTKGEVVQVVYDSAPEAIPIANSCWRNTRLPAHVTHCGECIPCFTRRIAIEHNVTPDPTRYHRDPWVEDIVSLAPEDEARRNLVDLAELVKRFERDDEETILSEWPELYYEGINAAEVISMYRRFSTEARSVLGRYRGFRPLLA
jgi:7-cyano-7-deazaguanine synthase in queuosine biosynthesis